MTNILFLLSIVLFVIILDVQANNNSTEETFKSSNDTTTSISEDRVLSKRQLHNVHYGFHNTPSYNRNRSKRIKRPRKTKRRPHIHHDVNTLADYNELKHIKQNQDERKHRINSQKFYQDSHEEYLNHPDLGNLGQVFDEDEIKDLFLSTDHEYGKVVRDYNRKLKGVSQPNKKYLDHEVEFDSDSHKDPDNYDFSEMSNSESNDFAFDRYLKHKQKYKKNDGATQLSPILKYELENIKDFGIRQNSYGEYPITDVIQESDKRGKQKYDKSSLQSDYSSDLLKTKHIKDQGNTKLYSNHAPSYTEINTDNFKFDTKHKDTYETSYKNDYPYSSNIPSITRNYASEFNFDTKPLKDITPTKFSIPDWNKNVNRDFEKIKTQSMNIDSIIESDLKKYDSSKDLNADLLKQFYQINNFQYYNPSSPGISGPSTLTTASHDQSLDSTINYYNKESTWKDNGWKVIDPKGTNDANKMVELSSPIIVPVPHPYPVKIPIAKPVAIPVVTEIKVPVEKEVPYPIVKKIPYPVEKPVPVQIEKEVAVKVPKPFPVKVPVIKNVHHHSRDKKHHHHNSEEWEVDSSPEHSHQETWEEYHVHYDDEEQHPHKTRPRNVLRNGRPKKSRRKTNSGREENLSYRSKKRSPPLGRKGGRARSRTRKDSNRSRSRYSPLSNKITITKRLHD